MSSLLKSIIIDLGFWLFNEKTLDTSSISRDEDQSTI